jgi:hypothetical protein
MKAEPLNHEELAKERARWARLEAQEQALVAAHPDLTQYRDPTHLRTGRLLATVDALSARVAELERALAPEGAHAKGR